MTETRPGIEVRQRAGNLILRLVRLGVPGHGPAGMREVFDAPPSPMPRAIPINLQHDRTIQLDAAATVRRVGDVIEAEATVPEGVRALVKFGRLAGASVEMRVHDSDVETDPHGSAVRRIRRWSLLEAAVVHSGMAGGSGLEVRQRGRTMRARVPVGKQAFYCSCSAKKTGAPNASKVRFEEGAFEGVSGRDVSATSGNLMQILGQTSDGSLRLSQGRGGALRVDLDPLDTRYGRELRELVAAGVPVHARPVWNPETSKWRLDGDTAVVSRADFTLLLVKPVAADKAAGLHPLAPIPEQRAGLPWDRRRLILAGLA